MSFNWQQKGWAMAYEALGGPETRYRLACVLNEPIEPLNEPLNASLDNQLVKLVKSHPGVQLGYLVSALPGSRATVKRAIAALVKAGKVEHRGSKKTGGYYAAARQGKDEA